MQRSNSGESTSAPPGTKVDMQCDFAALCGQLERLEGPDLVSALVELFQPTALSLVPNTSLRQRLWEWTFDRKAWQGVCSFEAWMSTIRFTDDSSRNTATQHAKGLLRTRIHRNWNVIPECILPDQMNYPGSKGFLQVLAQLSDMVPIDRARPALLATHAGRLATTDGRPRGKGRIQDSNIGPLDVKKTIDTLLGDQPLPPTQTALSSPAGSTLPSLAVRISGAALASSGDAPRTMSACPTPLLDHLVGLGLLQQPLPADFDHNGHLRIFAKAYHLRTSSTTSQLQEALGMIHRDGWQKVLEMHPERFLSSWSGHSHCIFAQPAKPSASFTYDRADVLRRWAKLPASEARAASEVWDEDGTIVIDGVFDHFRLDPDMEACINAEFDMYLHHFSPDPDAPRMGWLRNMHHSLIQQICRFDPVGYALNVVLRPDGAHRLVPITYITKDTPADQTPTGFLHADTDIRRVIAGKMHTNMLTAGYAMTDEFDDGCTVVVKGIHRRWRGDVGVWNYMVDKGFAKTADVTTTDCKWYHGEAEALFGPVEPTPCRKFGVRISRLDIIHGTTAAANRRRSVIFPWYMAYGPDYSLSDVPDTLTWAEAHACHRDRLPAMKEPSGKTPHPSPPKEPFPASVALMPPYSLGAAIMGYVKYEDPSVRRDLEALFGPDDERAFAFVASARAKILEQYRTAFALVRELEMETFGDNSYFATK